MITKTKFKPLLRDKVANIILTDEYCKEYVEALVIKATGLPQDIIKDNLVLVSSRVNSNVNVEYSYVDAIYENAQAIINIEVNYTEPSINDFKNMKYVCHLLLKQTSINEKIEVKPVYQINLNNYDVFKENKFMYTSMLMEKDIHKVRNKYITIIDINMDYLSGLEYNEIKEKEEDSLERRLYIFVCENKEILDKLYLRDEIMEKIREKLSVLTEDFAEGLYYDREEYLNNLLYEKGMRDKNIEIAKNLLKLEISDEDIMVATGLSKEELEDLKED